jgi:hypothetical protein
MGTMTAIYFEKPTSMPLLQLQGILQPEIIEENSQYYGLILQTGNLRADSDIIQSLSKSTPSNLFFLFFQSVVDAFEYHRWQSGKLQRSLIYGCFEKERTWESIKGVSENWEADIFFSEEELTRALEYAENDEVAKLQALWATQTLLEGQVLPSIDARETCRAIAEYFNFPGWE